MSKNIKHLTAISDLSDSDIKKIFQRAEYFKSSFINNDQKEIERIGNILKGKMALTLFMEDSTRTRISFEIAAKRLGCEVVNWDASRSSLSKKESFDDSVDNLLAMGSEYVIIRHSSNDAADEIACKSSKASIINAGTGCNEHPSQALLDAFTIREHFGKIQGLNISIVGDVAHSRVAGSNIRLLHRLGANIKIIAPEILLPAKDVFPQAERYKNLSEGCKGSDIIMSLRIQLERMEKSLIESEAQYFKDYGITLSVLENAGKNTMYMDPGPVVRGVQADETAIDNPQRSLVLKQVENGVFVRMAIMESLTSA